MHCLGSSKCVVSVKKNKKKYSLFHSGLCHTITYVSLESVLLPIIDEDKNTGQLIAARLFTVVARGTLQGKMSRNICCEYFIKKRCEIHSLHH
jgi:hypothetical protein